MGGSEYQAGVGIALTAETCTAIATLKSSEAAIAAGGVSTGSCAKDYPMIGPSIDEQYFILGGSSGNALISVGKEWKARISSKRTSNAATDTAHRWRGSSIANRRRRSRPLANRSSIA